ncbi:MAG: hypothetical protein IJ943_00735 [Akkermansia sp.]|nr:hypothetical protein [Akkermansia sp.]
MMKLHHIALSTLAALLPLLPAQEQAAPPAAQLSAQAHPFHRTDLYPAWSRMTPQQALTDLRAAIAQANDRLAAISAVTPETATFENTILAWYEAGENLKQTMNYAYHLYIVLGKKDMQHMMDTLMQESTNHSAEGLHAPRIAQVLQQAGNAPWVQQLSPEKQRFVQQTLRQLRDSGLTLTPEQQVRKAQIEQEISRLGFRFSQYVKMSPQVWELIITDPAELDGMPERWMQNAAAAARHRGVATDEQPAWLINLTNSPASAVLRYCNVAETRRKCWRGTTSAGTARTLDTEPLIHRILELRHELATLLGYDNFADKEAAHRMMGTGQRALAFVDDMLAKTKPAWDAYIAAELRRYSKASGKQLTAVAPWDTAYLDHHLPPARNKFNVKTITPYLQTDNVVNGLLNMWAGILSLRFEELPTVCLNPGEPCPDGKIEVWYPGVRCFAVKDAATGTHVGSFYLDLYTRPGKRGQAWCLPLRDGNPAPDGGVGEPHLAALMANIAPPMPGKPQLLSHSELYMLHHEFGHMMHMMLGHGEIRPHCTAEVERDFVEMPSHLQESWIWEPAALATFARHYQTGEPMPAELMAQLTASRGSNPIEMHMRMLLCSKLDLEMHINYEKYKGRPIDEVASEILAPWLFPYTEQPPTELRTLTYTMAEGYAACLYTYKWCEMLAADAMSRFKKEGVLNPATGADYRRSILERGSSVPAMQQIRDFLGRDPQPDALLELYRPR